MDKNNYLDLVPKKSSNIDWKLKDDKKVQIIIYRNSLLDKIIRKIFFTPEKAKIDLDNIGSFIWENIDGVNTVFDISKLVKQKFDDEAEPLLDRLITYVNILKNNKFIYFK